MTMREQYINYQNSFIYKITLKKQLKKKFSTRAMSIQKHYQKTIYLLQAAVIFKDKYEKN